MPIGTLATAPDTLKKAVKMGQTDNITMPGLSDMIKVGGKMIERNLLSAIIRPRIEEILEMLMRRLETANMQYAAGRHLSHGLTGFQQRHGTDQLAGIQFQRGRNRITHSQQTPDEQFAYCSKTETIKPDYASRAVTRPHLLPAVSVADHLGGAACSKDVHRQP